MTNTLLFTTTDAYNRNFDVSKFDVTIFNPGVNQEKLINEIGENTPEVQYMVECVKTWNRKYSLAEQIANACLGLIGEIVEYYEVYTADEFGDVLYYRTILKMLMGDSLEYNYDASCETTLWQAIGLLSDVGKKVAFHNKLGNEKTMERYKEAIQRIDNMILGECATLFHYDMRALERYNIEKLNKRHGNVFTPTY